MEGGAKGHEKKEFAWKLPDFSREKMVIENFNKRDLYDRRQAEAERKAELEKEQALEMFLHEKAFAYRDYMKQRAKALKAQMESNQASKSTFEKKTLKKILAEYYLEMIERHGPTA